MISPELLRRYPFFGHLNDTQLKDMAMIAEETTYQAKATIFEEGQPADALYLLLDGGVDLFYGSQEEYHPTTRKEFPVGEINPGEIFAISTLIKPYMLKATARAAQDLRVIKFNATKLRDLMGADPTLGCVLMKQIAEVAMERLAYTRIQLAAAWA